MSGDSLPIDLPLSGVASGDGVASILYRELRKPLLRCLICLGLSSDEAQDVVQDAFLSLHRHLAAVGSQEILGTRSADRRSSIAHRLRLLEVVRASLSKVDDILAREKAAYPERSVGKIVLPGARLVPE